MWDAQQKMLQAHYRTITCDARGHGRSPSPAAPYHFADLVADAIKVLDTHKVETASVMGLSLGGMTALGLGLTAPDRIERVVCCAARADAPPPFVQSWVDRLAILETGGITKVWEGTIDKWLSAETRAAHPGREASLREAFLATTEQGYCGCAEALKRLSYMKDLGSMTRPTLFVAGADDGGATPETMKAMAAACPGSVFAEVPNAKHVVNVDRPDEFAQVIAGFLALDAA